MNIAFKNSGTRVVRYSLEGNVLTLILGNKLIIDLESEQLGKDDKQISIFATNGVMNKVSGKEKIADIIIKRKTKEKIEVVETSSVGDPIYIYDYSEFDINRDVQLILWDTNYVRNSR
jgi:hypothetical protein